MNPTLAASLATLPSHIKWHPSPIFDTAFVAAEVTAKIILSAIVLRLDISISDHATFRLAANISSHDGPEIRVSSRNRPDILSAWTEVAEVVARVDAAAGAAMAGTPPA